MSVSVLDPETDIMDQFLDPETDIMGERTFMPFREIIRKKRLLFLHYILNQDKASVMYNVFKTQLKHKTPKDWVTMVIQDFKDLDWKIKFKDVKQMKKNKFVNIVHKTKKRTQNFERFN